MYTIWVWSSLLIAYNVIHPATWTVYLITSILNGFGAALVWVSQGSYLTDCSNIHNRGFYNGLFWLIYQCSQIIGNIIAAFVVEKMGIIGFTFVMGAFSIVGNLMFLGVMKPIKPDQVASQALPPPPPKLEESKDEKKEVLIDSESTVREEDSPLKDPRLEE